MDLESEKSHHSSEKSRDPRRRPLLNQAFPTIAQIAKTDLKSPVAANSDCADRFPDGSQAAVQLGSNIKIEQACEEVVGEAPANTQNPRHRRSSHEAFPDDVDSLILNILKPSPTKPPASHIEAEVFPPQSVANIPPQNLTTSQALPSFVDAMTSQIDALSHAVSEKAKRHAKLELDARLESARGALAQEIRERELRREGRSSDQALLAVIDRRNVEENARHAAIMASIRSDTIRNEADEQIDKGIENCRDIIVSRSDAATAARRRRDGG